MLQLDPNVKCCEIFNSELLGGLDIQTLSQATDVELSSFIEGISEVPDFLAPVIDMMCESCKYASMHTQDECHIEGSCFKSKYEYNLPELREELAEHIPEGSSIPLPTPDPSQEGKLHRPIIITKDANRFSGLAGCQPMQPSQT